MDIVLRIDDGSTLAQYEQDIENNYKSTLLPYWVRIEEFGVHCEIHLGWKNTQLDEIYKMRPPVGEGYTCYVICQIKDSCGKIVESKDHDFYMDFAWIVSNCRRNAIYIYPDVDEDAISMMSDCIAYLQNPY